VGLGSGSPKSFISKKKRQETVLSLKDKKAAEKWNKRIERYMRKTKETGNMREKVMLPKGVDHSEWVAENLIDFVNDVSYVYSLCSEDAKRFQKPGAGFPPGCRYIWLETSEGASEPTPLSLSSPDYCLKVLQWIESVIADDSVFPENHDHPFPPDFADVSRKILNRIFRVYAIIYHVHFDVVEEQEADLLLNTSFKHLMFFMFEFDLLDDKETKSLKDGVERLRNEYLLTPCSLGI